MSIQKDQLALEEDIEQNLVDYLRENPEFFIEHAGLLATLKIPHEVNGQAVSLIEYQVKVLRERNEKLNRKLKEMITNARNNDALNDRILNMAGQLIREQAGNSRIRTIIECMQNDFNADAVAVKLYDPNDYINDRTYILDNACEDTHKLFKNFLTAKRPMCGQLRVEQLRFLMQQQQT